MLGEVYYDPQHEASFGTLEKLKRVAKKTGVAKPGEVKPWLEQQDAYTINRPVRKRFPKNPTASIILWTYGSVTSWTYRLSAGTMTASNIC